MVVAPLIEPLFIILTFLGALILAWLAERLVKALFQEADSAFGWIPWLGSKITGSLFTIEQRITHFMGSVVLSSQHRIATSWHSAARLVEEVGQKIEAALELGFAITGVLAELATWKGVLALYKSLVGSDRAHVTNIREQGKTAAQTKAQAAHAVKVATQAQVRAQAIPADVVIPGDLTGLRGRVKEAENEISRLWERVRSFGKTGVEGVALGALAFALSKLGLPWARCSNVGKVGKNVCGMNQDLLDSLLAGTALVLGSISIVELAKACQEITGACEDGVSFFVREVT